MDVYDYLEIMLAKDASDLYLTTGAIPSVKINGQLSAIDDTPLANDKTKEMAYQLMQATDIERFERQLEMNLALSISGKGRFRVNIFLQRGQVGLVIRNIKLTIPSFAELELPPSFQDLIMQKRGLILLVGATGSGKTTSLASMIDYRNSHAAGHIITIEDPIEFMHSHKLSIVNQREVGLDTLSYEEALKNTLRQSPDVILIGEIRTQETMQHALAFAETGHLCLSSLHANNANQALERIISFFPVTQHPQLLLDLSLNLQAIISQRLIPTLDGKRTLALEILLNTPLISDLIKRGDVTTIKDIMQKSEDLGMQTFDAALFKLYQAGKISLEEALRNADSENNLKLRISLQKGVAKTRMSHLKIEEKF